MTREELNAAKREQPCRYLRYYGKPAELVSRGDFLNGITQDRIKRAEEDKETREFLKKHEYPEGLTENEMLDFIYLRACLFLRKKPIGDFEGNAEICARVLQRGGSIVDMYEAGADIIYASCLSHYDLDADIQREIIEAHIPF